MVDESSKYCGVKESFHSNRRRVSDDVTSLDSWSELTADRSSKRNSDEIKSERRTVGELVLDPQQLCNINEPAEIQVTRVKLEKSPVTKFHKSKYAKSSKFFRILDSVPQEVGGPLTPALDDENTIKGKFKKNVKMKKKKQENLPQPPEQLCEECNRREEDYSLPGSEPRSLETRHTENFYQSDLCNCSHCLSSTSGHKSLPNLPSQEAFYSDSRSSQSYLKKHASIPYLQTAMSQRTNACDTDESEIEQSEKVKNKIMSVWNNVRYGECLL